jgi:OmpA-OmpF porin, OOP family
MTKPIRLTYKLIFIIIIFLSILFNCSTESKISDKAFYNSEEDNFYNALALGYKQLAEKERLEYDWQDADKFAKKAIKANNNQSALPEDPYLREINKRSDLIKLLYARKQLLPLLSNDLKIKHPLKIAYLQITYDRWVEEVEEFADQKDIIKLSHEFKNNLALLHKEIAFDKKAPKIENKILKNHFVIYFDTANGELDYQATKKLNKIISRLRAEESYMLILEGHSDVSGKKAYNMQLSVNRIKSVKRYLLDAGIKPYRFFEFKAYGKSKLKLKNTAQDKTDRENRRVEVFIIKKDA